MPTTAEAESDPLFQLLTDALRAGPGSSQWRQAVDELRESGVAENDERRLLLTAREHLQSGRDYRSVRAGVGFTRKLFQTIEQEESGKRPATPAANLIAIVSGVVIMAIIIAAVWLVSRPAQSAQADLETLAKTYFPTVAASAQFTDGLPAGWRQIGKLPLNIMGGLKPGDVPKDATEGGGVVTTAVTAASEPFAVEALITLPKDSGPILTQIFVSDSPDFSADRATAPQELVWLADAGRQRVAVDGRVQNDDSAIETTDGQLRVRMTVGPALAIVESGANSKRLWAGPHNLAPDKPRYVGVRFLRRPGEAKETPTVQSIEVRKPAPSAGGGGT